MGIIAVLRDRRDGPGLRTSLAGSVAVPLIDVEKDLLGAAGEPSFEYGNRTLQMINVYPLEPRHGPYGDNGSTLALASIAMWHLADIMAN